MFALLQTSFEPKGTIVETVELKPIDLVDAKASFSSLRQLFYYAFSIVILGLVVYGAYLYLSKKREASYIGKELPGIQDIGPAAAPPKNVASKKPTVQEPPLYIPPQRIPEIIKQPDDIAIVTGRIPVWTEVLVEQETKVSENDPTIVKLIQEREALNKKFEESFAKNQKPKNI